MEDITEDFNKILGKTNKTNEDLGKENNNPQFECECDLLFINKYYNETEDNIFFFKEFSKNIKIFKKNVYDKLTPYDKKCILLLDKYKMKDINNAIKSNIQTFKDILNQEK